MWGGHVRIWLNLAVSRKLGKYITCTVEDLSYIATAENDGVMRSMYTERVNFAGSDMKRFYELSKKYYNVDDSAGYFLDLGANIGTTGIYFLKKFAPNLKLLAFEPDVENFKCLRMNLILNDMEDKTTAVNCGVGDKFDEMTMYRTLQEPGANSVVQHHDFFSYTSPEIIKIIPVDGYLSENKISAADVKYVWIDTEGFEPQVLLGAKNLIRENPVPLFVEYNITTWHKSGRMEELMKLLTEHYSHFINFDGGKETLYPIEALPNIEPWPGSWTRGDVFFIKNGVID